MSARTAILAALVAVASANINDRSYYEEKFFNWLAQHKVEATSGSHFVAMLQNFANNDDLIESHNKLNSTYKLGHNQFSHMTVDEWRAYVKLGLMKKPEVSTAANVLAAPANTMALPSSIDWSTKGAVTPVKNQGQCGSCWSFSTTGNIEGQWFLAGNTLTSLSEQELVSCDTTDDGCDGGLPTQAMAWLISSQNGQSITEASDEYNSGTGFAPSCPANLNSLPVGATITSYTNIGTTEDDMAAYCLANGPVSIGVDATSFQTYTSGILTNCISQQVDHAVLIAGFDDTNVPPYWIIKNSWGASWGEAGYIRVQKGTDQCLITTFPSSAIVSSSKQ
eukprot:GDKK01000535.1.p1 GENE.GDKK01000535.1~~GDKK01000535.1.p1  ORF type:complete len:343 (-),score=98.72 GDKK01000535.1:144-1151(-)